MYPLVCFGDNEAVIFQASSGQYDEFLQTSTPSLGARLWKVNQASSTSPSARSLPGGLDQVAVKSPVVRSSGTTGSKLAQGRMWSSSRQREENSAFVLSAVLDPLSNDALWGLCCACSCKFSTLGQSAVLADTLPSA